MINQEHIQIRLDKINQLESNITHIEKETERVVENCEKVLKNLSSTEKHKQITILSTADFIEKSNQRIKVFEKEIIELIETIDFKSLME